MTKTLRNFWLDLAMFTLLGVNIATLPGARTAASAAGLRVGGHIHVISGIILMLGCLVHIALHWQWLQAVLAGRAKGRIKLSMNSLVTLAMLVAGVSGHAALESAAASRFHDLTGSIALIGLSIHAIKHVRWMASVTKRFVIGRLGSASPSQ